MKNLKQYSNIGAYNTDIGSETMPMPNVGLIQDTNEVKYNENQPPFVEQYLTFIPLEACSFKIIARNFHTTGNTAQYSLDYGTTWTTLAHNESTPTIEAGHKVYWKASGNTTYYRDDSPDYTEGIFSFSATSNFIALGNVMSLVWGDEFNDDYYYTPQKKYVKKYTIINKAAQFAFLFLYCNEKLADISNLTLPATISTEGAYEGMFYGCSLLTTVPNDLIKINQIYPSNFRLMFAYCTSLTNTPTLPSGNISRYCFNGMFKGCTSLTAAPSLSANTLNDISYACYANMFEGCTSLTNVPSNMLPSTVLTESCYASMFAGCTSLTTAPTLPAEDLKRECYNSMFSGCTNLNYAKVMGINIKDNGFDVMSSILANVSQTGTFVKNTLASWSDNAKDGLGNYYIPQSWTIQKVSS